jgi:hypothetical protein
MTQTRHTSSIHSRKKWPRPADVLSYIGSHLDKTKQRDTPSGMIFTISDILRSLPLPGIKTEFYQEKSGPQAITIFPSIPPPITDDEEMRETIYKRTADRVCLLGQRAVPQDKIWKLLTNFDPWNRGMLQYLSGIVSALRTVTDGEQEKLRQLRLLLSDPPAIHPLPQEELTRLREYTSQLEQRTESVEQKMQEAAKRLAKAKTTYASKKSPHLDKIKGSLFQLIRKSTRWSPNRTARELTALLSAWNTDLAGKDSSHRIASYRR